MIWKKESKKKDALYIDFFKLKGQFTRNTYYSAVQLSYIKNPQSTCTKSNEISLKKRKDGNKAFQEREWTVAMEKYNESLCHAKIGSKHVSLAYANRSACFFNMKKYNECLVDIQLAKENGYPEDLMAKLDTRKADCLRLIAEGAQVNDDFGMKLSFESDTKFPCMANVVSIKRDDKGKLSLVANTDIDVGKTIAIEKAFTTCLYTRFGWRCILCLKQNSNLVPCKTCNVAMFCHDECENSPLHSFECGLKCAGHYYVFFSLMNEIRTVIKVVNMFPSIDELMKFVEEAVTTDPNELPDTLQDEKSQYRAYLKLPYGESFAHTDLFR